jgi:hypothetical protein
MTMDLVKQGDSDPFHPAIKAFEHQYIRLRRTWLVFETLFMKTDNVKLLNQASAQTFHEIGISMLEHLLLQLSRLTDHPGADYQKHLCLRRIRCDLISYLKECDGVSYQVKHREFLDALQSLVNESGEIAKKLRLHRNESIAHLDWGRALGTVDKPLPSLTFGELGSLIMLIGEIVHNVTNYLWKTGHQHEWDPYDQAANLFNALEAYANDS